MAHTSSVQAVILAAGQGKRMHSNLPKVLHPVAGKALAQHVIETARQLSPEKLVIVYGHGGEVVRATLEGMDAQKAHHLAGNTGLTVMALAMSAANERSK